jgi:hypothetical protein
MVMGVLVSPTATALPPLPGDIDADGVSDQDEINSYHSDPNKTDTDGDRVDDGNEVNKRSRTRPAKTLTVTVSPT